MQQLIAVWTALSISKRIFVVGATLAMFLAIAGVSKIATAPNMELLYSGLDSKTSGDILAALESRGAQYEVRGNAIFVSSANRDTLRMDLATEGLPGSATTGYELLDQLSGFGTTSQMFDAAYWRAKEGELARTIISNPHVRNARVHIANQSSSPFSRSDKASASVTLSTASGALPLAQAKAIQFLVASAVSGLAPQDVAVIDDQYGMIDTTTGPSGISANQDGASDALRKKVQRIVEARVGRGNVMVEVSVETVTEHETISETTIDPNSRVAISTTVEERTSSQNGSSGQVTVASNLPEGDAGSAERKSEGTETREQTNFEVSEIRRELEKVPGAIKRLTVAVLVNGTKQIAEDGSEQFSPRPDSEMADLRELVASAVGFSEERGDTITLKSLEFEPLPNLPEPAQASLLNLSGVNAMELIKLGALFLVILFVSLFIVRPILKQSNAQPATVDLPQLGVDGPADMVTPETSSQSRSDLPQLENEPADPAERLRLMIEERHDETVEVLRRWISDPKGQT